VEHQWISLNIKLAISLKNMAYLFWQLQLQQLQTKQKLLLQRSVAK
jgi:hypothetical protein